MQLPTPGAVLLWLAKVAGPQLRHQPTRPHLVGHVIHEEAIQRKGNPEHFKKKRPIFRSYVLWEDRSKFYSPNGKREVARRIKQMLDGRIPRSQVMERA